MNILLHGGGLDSTAVFLKMVKENLGFQCYHIDYGQAASDLEHKAIKAQCQKYMVPLRRLSDSVIRALNPAPNKLFGDKVDNYYVESRNLVFIMHLLRANTEYKNQPIYMGLDKPVSGTPLPDCSQEFIDSVFNSFGARIVAPLIEVDKLDFCREAYLFDSSFFELSMTCWTPVNGNECGECKHCVTKSKIVKEIKGA